MRPPSTDGDTADGNMSPVAIEAAGSPRGTPPKAHDLATAVDDAPQPTRGKRPVADETAP
ncbi:hypothetical protein SAMN05216252_11738 [Actinacidiphila glaucinigra]|uniref:Uncharacterized protein n=1 Tax=Actinacidiphila glaucinigra TaxID=235986 RepID=A0A239KUH7_9ACTN|nr:hypothetical protein SAMN05216252_11738 [Actinacidiphila glaucinigra]